MIKYSLIFISLIYTLPVYALSWLGLWTSQKNIDIANHKIPYNRSDNTIIDLTLMNLNIGHQVQWGEGSARGNLILHKPQSVFKQFQDTQALANIDIMEALQNSNNKKQTLNTYLNHIKQSIALIETTKSQLSQEISTQNSKYNECQASKLQGDGLYYQGLQQLSTHDLEQGLEQSITYGKCAIEHRIRSNAASALYAKLIVYTEALSYRYNILSTHQDLIINHFNVFKDSYLEKLMTVKDAFGGIDE